METYWLQEKAWVDWACAEDERQQTGADDHTVKQNNEPEVTVCWNKHSKRDF